MLVVVADSIPPSVRGKMKLWFIEIKPNVFISSVKDSVAEKVTAFLFSYCPVESNLILVKGSNKPPYYSIIKKGSNLNYISDISGLPLVFDK